MFTGSVALPNEAGAIRVRTDRLPVVVAPQPAGPSNAPGCRPATPQGSRRAVWGRSLAPGFGSQFTTLLPSPGTRLSQGSNVSPKTLTHD